MARPCLWDAAWLLADLGEAVQVDPIKPKWKAPRTERLKLQYDALLSNFGFKFNLRRYTLVLTSPHSHSPTTWTRCCSSQAAACRQGLPLVHLSAQRKRLLWDKGCLEGVKGVFMAGVEGVSTHLGTV